jgi:hypothetical protein
MEGTQIGRWLITDRFRIDLYIPRVEQGAPKGTQGHGCRLYFTDQASTATNMPLKQRPPAFEDLWGDRAKNLRDEVEKAISTGQVTVLLAYHPSEEAPRAAAAGGKR